MRTTHCECKTRGKRLLRCPTVCVSCGHTVFKCDPVTVKYYHPSISFDSRKILPFRLGINCMILVFNTSCATHFRLRLSFSLVRRCSPYRKHDFVLLPSHNHMPFLEVRIFCHLLQALTHLSHKWIPQRRCLYF